MASYPCDFSNPVMWSDWVCSQGPSGMGNTYRVPGSSNFGVCFGHRCDTPWCSLQHQWLVLATNTFIRSIQVSIVVPNVPQFVSHDRAGICPFLFYFKKFVGKEGKCVMHCVWDSIGACCWAYLPVGQYALQSYPLRPLLRQCPRYILLCEINLSISFHFFCYETHCIPAFLLRSVSVPVLFHVTVMKHIVSGLRSVALVIIQSGELVASTSLAWVGLVWCFEMGLGTVS